MWDYCYQGKSVLTPESASKLCLSISHVITNWLKSLPKELIPNILIRLPLKSLVKFTSVCKSWNSTIKHPTFIRTHLTHTLTSNYHNAPPLLLLHTVLSEGTSSPFGRVHISGFIQDHYSLHCDDHAVTEHCKVEFPVVALREELINPCLRVAGTCNGLVLLADDLGRYGYTFVIWNPSVRKYVTLPKPSVRFSTHGGYDASLGLGYDDVGNDYKVVRLTTLLDYPSEQLMTVAQVYSLATGSWGMLRNLPPCAVPDSWLQVLVNGALHWLALRGMGEHLNYFVVAFDVGSERHREIMLPKSFTVEKPVELRLCASGDRKSIALFVRCKGETDCYLDIWVMKEYCIEKSWTKLMILTPQGPKRSLPEALCFRRIGEVLLVLEDDRGLISLDIGSKQFKNLGISGGQLCSVDFYEESLVLLDRKDAVSY